MRTRAFRRHKQQSKFRRRAKRWHQWNGWKSFNEKEVNTWAMYWSKASRGINNKFLRTTGRPCSCAICRSYKKYRRIRRDELLKIISQS